MSESPEQEVRTAAEALIQAFGSHDRDGYFAAFAPEASFVFYNVEQRLGSRAAYEELWRSWEADGFRVLSCASDDAEVRMVGTEVGIFTHRVTTRLAGEELTQHERETIVFQRQAGAEWLAVHEHLSPMPS